MLVRLIPVGIVERDMVSREGGREPALEQENPAEQDAESEHEEEDAKDAEEEGIVIESESVCT